MRPDPVIVELETSNLGDAALLACGYASTYERAHSRVTARFSYAHGRVYAALGPFPHRPAVLGRYDGAAGTNYSLFVRTDLLWLVPCVKGIVYTVGADEKVARLVYRSLKRFHTRGQGEARMLAALYTLGGEDAVAGLLDAEGVE